MISLLAKSLVLSLFVFASASYAVGPFPGRMKNLVTFGDSYSAVINPGDDGTAWPIYAASYGHFDLFPFAISGATCSNNITPVSFESVMESQLPTYLAELKNGSIKINLEETMHTLWIGTNDVGASTLTTGQQVPGVTLVDVIKCPLTWIQRLYEAGARNFIIQNMIPLEHTILYSAESYPNHYWTATRNTTAWNLQMTEFVAAGNELSRLMLTELAPQIPGAHLGIFDSNSLFSDILTNPAQFLNGTVPFNLTGSISSCVYSLNESTSGPAACTEVPAGPERDSYIWFDELHPSEQSDRNVAKFLSGAINRTSDKYITWLL